MVLTLVLVVMLVLFDKELKLLLFISLFLSFRIKLKSLVVPLAILLFGLFHVLVSVDNVGIEFRFVVILCWISWLLDGIWVVVPDMVELLLSNIKTVPGGKYIWSVGSEIWNFVVNWIRWVLCHF